MSEPLKLVQVQETTHELSVPHMLIEYTDGSVVLMRKEQADLFVRWARAAPYATRRTVTQK